MKARIQLSNVLIFRDRGKLAAAEELYRVVRRGERPHHQTTPHATIQADTKALEPVATVSKEPIQKRFASGSEAQNTLTGRPLRCGNYRQVGHNAVTYSRQVQVRVPSNTIIFQLCIINHPCVPSFDESPFYIKPHRPHAYL